MLAGLTAAVVAPAPAPVQVASVGADFVWLGYALTVFGGLALMVQVATLVVLIGRR